MCRVAKNCLVTMAYSKSSRTENANQAREPMKYFLRMRIRKSLFRLFASLLLH